MPHIGQMLFELQKVVDEYKVKEDVEMKSADRLKGMDDYQLMRDELMPMIHGLREDVKILKEMREAAPDGRDMGTIRKQNENAKKLKEAGALVMKLKDQVMADMKKGKIQPEILEVRKKDVMTLGRELEQLNGANDHVKAVSAEGTTIASSGDLAKRRTDREARREARRKQREAKAKAAEDSGQPAPVEREPEGVAQFKQEVEVHEQKLEGVLDTVITGLTELQNVGEDMKQTIAITQQQIEDVTDKAAKLNKQFKSSNKRLKELLEESGGCSRWCPMLVCVIILIALIGYMTKMMH